MADNYLITGYWGEPHVTVENDRGFNAAVFGAGKSVLSVGEMFRAEYIGNNTIRIYDGKLIDNGAVAGIPAGEYIELLIPEAGQAMNRNDLVIFEYSRDASTLVESGTFKVITGTETSGAAVDPVLTENDLLSNIASFDQMALWRIPVSGATISAPVQMFEVSKNIKNAGSAVVKATSSDGMLYYANVPGVKELYTGLEFTIIPDFTSATTLPTLNINDLGSVHIKRRITSNTTTTVQSEDNNFLQKDQPIRVFYNGKVWVADMARTNANDIYGTVPVENGGTGADNADEACRKLGAIKTSQKGVANGVASLDSNKRIPVSQLPDATSGVGTLTTNGALTISSGYANWKKVGHILFIKCNLTLTGVTDPDYFTLYVENLPINDTTYENPIVASIEHFIVGNSGDAKKHFGFRAKGNNTTGKSKCIQITFIAPDLGITESSNIQIRFDVVVFCNDVTTT